jgi:CRP-like cAMP-binding protein
MATPRAKALESLPLFAGLSNKDRELLASNLDEVSFAPGTAIIRQGETNHAFFLLVEGEADVSVSGQPRRIVGPGDFFGEISMAHRIPATANVIARTAVRAYVMSHAQFGALQVSAPIVARLEAAMSERLVADRKAAGQGGPSS